MGLDIYVMPIWKFKAGNYTSPLEALGRSLVVVSPDGMTRRDGSARPGLLTRWKAKRATKRLRIAIEAETGHKVRWNDEGSVAYAQQAHGIEALRAFAKWLDYRDMFPRFEPPVEGNYDNHPVMSKKLVRPLTYPHLVEHSCFTGYYLPTDLERVLQVEPFSSWGGFVLWHSVGSSIRLKKELDRLSQILGVNGEYVWDDADPLAAIKAPFTQLYEVAKISCNENLPIVFHG